jgi:hypothetical protein
MSIDDFFMDNDKPEIVAVWGNPVEREVWRRIRLSVAAYA